MSSFFTNGATTLKFRNGDFQIVQDTPHVKRQLYIPNSSMIPTIRDRSTAKEQILRCEGLFYKDDQTGLAGRDSLYSFWENSDNTGVDQMAKSFMVTDADGNQYQCRFSPDFEPGFRVIKKASQYRGSFTLIAEPTLPTLDTTLVGWWAAYDMDDSGDLSAWTTLDPVGGSGTEWDDKESTNDGVQSVANSFPFWTTSQINGRPAIDFDGAATADYLTTDGIATSFTGADTALTVYIVADWDALADGQTLLALDNSSTANHYIRFRYESSAQFLRHRSI